MSLLAAAPAGVAALAPTGVDIAAACSIGPAACFAVCASLNGAPMPSVRRFLGAGGSLVTPACQHVTYFGSISVANMLCEHTTMTLTSRPVMRSSSWESVVSWRRSSGHRLTLTTQP